MYTCVLCGVILVYYVGIGEDGLPMTTPVGRTRTFCSLEGGSCGEPVPLAGQVAVETQGIGPAAVVLPSSGPLYRRRRGFGDTAELVIPLRYLLPVGDPAAVSAVGW